MPRSSRPSCRPTIAVHEVAEGDAGELRWLDPALVMLAWSRCQARSSSSCAGWFEPVVTQPSGALRPWYLTAAGYLAVLFRDSQEAPADR